LGERGSIEESQADCRAAQRDRTGGLATTARQAPRSSLYLAKAANRLDSLLGGYDLATLEKGKGSAEIANPL
jgi:hypothetical protein